MENFLNNLKINLNNCDKTVIVVLGNESCDLDSAVSAIIFSYFIYKINKYSGIVIPILNVTREDLALRTEVVHFMKKIGFSLEDLLCKDEIDLIKLKNENRLLLILVDHNVPSDEHSFLKESIVQIVDHHAVHDPELISKCESKIENVGSCCTLVAEELLRFPHLLTPEIALLLFGTILLDTVCLQESAKRVTQKDKDVAKQLKSFLNGAADEKEIFNELQKAKFDTSSLTPAQLLRKDTKLISQGNIYVTIASLPKLIETALQHEEFIPALSEMASKKSLSFIVIMGSEMSEDSFSIKRQIAIYDESKLFLNKISSYLLSLECPSLNLCPLPSNSECLKLFDQENSSLSRKFVLPAVQQFLKFECNG